MSRKLPIVFVGWTEYEREPGWGATQRYDGISIHLTNDDCASYKQQFLAKPENCQPVTPDYYERPSDSPQVVDVEESLYNLLAEKRAEGVFGIRIHNKKQAALIMEQGRNPFVDGAGGYRVRFSSPWSRSPVDDEVAETKTAAFSRANRLEGVGFNVEVVDVITNEVVYTTPSKA
jgi:hypothetical protein